MALVDVVVISLLIFLYHFLNLIFIAGLFLLCYGKKRY